jgi:peptidoglycan/LPS O-acetylase OafA/YrhL
MRGMGVIVIMLSHFGFQSIEYTWIVLQWFFVLSGFLISRILLEEKNKPGTIYQRFKVYWMRRVLRIFPVYYLYVAFLGIIFLLYSFPPDYSHKLIYLSTITYNLSRVFHIHFTPIATHHLWTMSVEEQFYLFLPFVILTFSTGRLKIITVFFIIFSFFFRYLYAEWNQPDDDMGTIIYWFTPCQLDAFFIGVAINLFNAAKWKRRKLYLFVWWIFVTVAGILNYIHTPDTAQTVADYLVTFGYHSAAMINYQHVWSYTLINIFFGLLIVVVGADSGNEKAWLNKIFRIKLFNALGKVSYAMYVYHFGLLILFQRFIIPDLASVMSDWKLQLSWFLIFSVSVYLVAWVSYRFFETKFLNMKPKYAEAKSQ